MRRHPPTLEDAFLAGLPLAVGVKLERLIEAEPDTPADQWWDLFAILRENFARPHQRPAAAPV